MSYNPSLFKLVSFLRGQIITLIPLQEVTALQFNDDSGFCLAVGSSAGKVRQEVILPLIIHLYTC